MKRKLSEVICFFLLFILLLLFVYTFAKSYSNYIFTNLSNSFIRFHVVANSNSTEDQIIKYKVRDEVMNYVSPLLKDAHSKDEALEILNNHLNELFNLTEGLIHDENKYYPIHISIGKSYFPTKDYDSFILPEGHYDALKIELGEAQGQNWWCVMFPSVCIPQPDDISLSDNSLSILEKSLSSEGFSIISKNSTSVDVKIKFKLIELFENI